MILTELKPGSLPCYCVDEDGAVWYVLPRRSRGRSRRVSARLLTCGRCGVEYPMRCDRVTLYCSRTCANRATAERGRRVRCGAENPKWRGGRRVSNGYVLVRVLPDDPMWSMAVDGYVREHRLVVARSLGRPLDRDEQVHHINGDKADNRLENLQLVRGGHANGCRLCCADCGSNNVVAVELS